MRRVGCIVSLVALSMSGCGEDDTVSSFRAEACALAEANASDASERREVGSRASELAASVGGRRVSRDTANILSLVTLLPALAAAPEGQKFPGAPANLPLPNGSRPAPRDLDEALAAIREECGGV
jgi:hypothetical protein